jgi:hypothetical protein
MTGTGHVVVLAVVLAFASAGLTMASQQRPYRVSDQQPKDLVKRIETHRDAFHASVKRAIDRSPIHDTPADEQIGRSVNDFAQAMDRLRDRVNDRKSDTADAEDVLRRASSIDNHMMRNQLDTPAQSDWQALRLDMNELAHAYGITANWSAASRNTPYRDADKQVEQLLKQIGEKADRFDTSLDRAFDSSRIDVEDVLERGLVIDGFVRRHQVNAQAEQARSPARHGADDHVGCLKELANDPGWAALTPHPSASRSRSITRCEVL